MTTTSTTTPSTLQLKLNEALTGSENALPKGSSIQISGKATTQAQIITALEGFLEPFTDAATAKAAYAAAIQARTTSEKLAHEYLLTLKVGLAALFGRNSPSLAQFGMGAKVRATPSAQTTVLATAKRQVTKQLRGTLTKAEKAATKSVGTPDVSLGLTGLQVSPGAAQAAQSAALATALAGASTLAAASTPPVAAASAPGSSAVTPAPVAPAPVASTPSAALVAAGKQS